MSDLRATFNTEAIGHLDAAQAVLLAAEWQSTDAAAIAGLFRAVHSVKGLARVMDLSGMETLGHAAEEVIGMVRAGKRPLDPSLVNLLLRATDDLRRMAGAAETQPRPDPTLLAALVSAAMTPASMAPALGGTPSRSASPWALLSEDRDLLEGLRELLEQEVVPAFAGAPVRIPEAKTKSKQRKKLVASAEEADILRHACQRLDLPGLAAMLDCASEEIHAALVSATGRIAWLLGAAPPVDLPPAAPPTSADDALALGLDGTMVLPHPLPAPLWEVAVVWPAEADAQQALLVTMANALHARMAEGQEALLVLLAGDADEAPPVPDDCPPPRRLTREAPSLLFAPPKIAGIATMAADTGVRVPVEVLDRLFGRVGQFFSVGARLTDLIYDDAAPDALRRLGDLATLRLREALPEVARLRRFRDDVAAVQADIAHLISLIHDATLGLRVIPLETLFSRFPRMIRETANAAGKQVRFVVEDAGIQVDKGMADLLADPLTHMLRNAVDHGVEPPEARVAAGKPPTARLQLTAEQSGNRVTIAIADDGRGLDLARIRTRAIEAGLTTESEAAHLTDEQVARFIFAAGFTTKDTVTDTSGRGVGMDVVLVNVTRLGGRIDIQTTAGRGTTFRLNLPLSAAVQPMLLAETGVQTLAFPEAMVIEAVALPPGSVQSVNRQPAALLHGHFLPLFAAVDLLGLTCPTTQTEFGETAVIVCSWAGRRIGITVQRILRRSEMLVREAHPRVAALPGIGGVTLLGADRIVLIVEPDELLELAARAGTTGLRAVQRAPLPA